MYGRNFRVVAQADTAFRDDIQDLKQYYVINRQGEQVPLSALVSHKVTENAPVISHFNLFRVTEINGNAAPGYSSGQAIAGAGRSSRRKYCRPVTATNSPA